MHNWQSKNMEQQKLKTKIGSSLKSFQVWKWNLFKNKIRCCSESYCFLFYCLHGTSTDQHSHDHLSQILLFRILHLIKARVILLIFVNKLLLGVDSGILITLKGEQYTCVNNEFLVTKWCRVWKLDTPVKAYRSHWW